MLLAGNDRLDGERSVGMIDATGEIDLANPEALGSHLIGRLQHLETMNRISPGMTADWGLQVGSHVFAFTIRVVRPEEMEAA